MASKASKAIFVVAAKRTPFGTFGGKLKTVTATELGTIATKAAFTEGKIDPKTIGVVFAGNCIQSSLDAPYLARHVGLKAGCPQGIPALTVNRLCGSGFESIMNCAEAIELGQTDVALAVGAENMSAAPFHVDGNRVRWGVGLGQGPELKDALWAGLTDALANMPMGVTAENLAVKYKITREEVDKVAIRSQTNYFKAKEKGIFKTEIVPVEVKGKKGPEVVEHDEHPRMPDVNKIGKLPTVFKKGGVITAANASGINDGAGALVLATEDAIKKYGYTPLARVVSWSRTGCDPTIMGIGPVDACNTALAKAGLTIDDMDLIEINEAFSSQYLACARDLKVDESKTNLNGGAIALGHPLGASGSRIMTHLTYELRRTGKKYGIGSACCGGGQGVAVILERA